MHSETTEPKANNDELEAYLLRYCTGPLAPYFAVMLEGPWGSGKTWFIEHLRRKLENQHAKRCLYVSLYGVAQTSDITDQFFQQLHPRLASEAVQRSWSIFRSAIKASLRIDLNVDDERDTLNLSIPELGNWTGPDGAVLIFDDLERCQMKPSEILGFINQFVEHDGYRVLVLANEQKISGEAEKFETIKEKVIGRTFKIHPQDSAALDCFIDELVSDDSIEVLKGRKKIILDVQRRANYRNLRSLRQSVLDFSDIWACLPVEDKQLKQNARFLDRLVSDMFSLSIEHRAATLTSEHIATLEDGPVAFKRLVAITQNQAAEYSEAEKRLNLHNLTASWELALAPKTYSAFFSKGRLTKEEAVEGITLSSFFVDETEPTWRRLWYWQKLDNATFGALSNEVLNKLSQNVYSDWGELYHVVAILLNQSELRLIQHDKEQVLALAKRVVDQLECLNKIDFGDRSRDPRDYFDRDAAFGHRFLAYELPEFVEFSSYYEAAIGRGRERASATWVSDWLDELRGDVEIWSSRIDRYGGDDAYFSRQPIFKYVDAAKMVEILLNCRAEVIFGVSRSIGSRYIENAPFEKWQADERAFWRDCKTRLNASLTPRELMTPSTYALLEHLIPMIERVLVYLNNAFGEPT